MVKAHGIRVFKQIRATTALAQNREHNFALQRSMLIYGTNALCTIIPKNACSTLRFSIAKANGCVRDIKDIDWIHANNQTFMASTETAAQAAYSFVILRCPYTRLFSAFMDKMVEIDVQAWKLRNVCARKFHPHDITFKAFLNLIQKMLPSQHDNHWRRQSDFLLYDTYDDYFQFENLPTAFPVIEEKTGLEIIDTRDGLGHGLTQHDRETGLDQPYGICALDLLVRKKKGLVPNVKEMFDDELIAIVKKVYAEDLDIYERKFGKSDLMVAFN